MPLKKKTSRDYPESYFKILEFFSHGKDENMSVKMLYNQAVSRRHHFYRFCRALADDYGKDHYLTRMSNIANTIVVSINPSKAKASDEVEIIFSVNPLELALMDVEEKIKDKEVILPGTGEGYDAEEIEKLISSRVVEEEDDN